MKNLLLSILLAVSTAIQAFNIDLTIKTIPADAKIYINGEFMGTGTYLYHKKNAEPFKLKVVKPGFKTTEREYIYKGKTRKGEYFSFSRGDATIIVELEEDVISVSTSNQAESLSKLETLKTDGLITSEEAFDLKENLLSTKPNNEKIKAITELTTLRVLLSEKDISKEDYAIVKRKIIFGQYDYSKGNTMPEQLAVIKSKFDSGRYSKDDVFFAKKKLIDSYK